jgi:hypothetical protein
MKSNKIFFEIRKIIKRFSYNLYFFFSDNYITHNDFLQNNNLLNQKSHSCYENFLINEVLVGKGYSKFEQKIILVLITILLELSAKCSSHQIKLLIVSKEINLKKININLQRILPTDTKYKLLENKIENIKNTILINLSSEKIYQDALNIFFKKENEKINVVDYSDKINHDFPIFIKEIHEYKKIKDSFYNTKVTFNNFFKKIIYFKKIFKSYSVKYNEINSNKNFFFIKKNNVNLVYKDSFKIIEEKNIVLSFHGTISKKNMILNETRSLSLRDGLYNGLNDNKNKTSIPKVNKFINSSCIVFPTTGSSIGHYFLESLSTLLLFKNYNKLKIIVDYNIPKYIVDILNYFKVEKKNIIKKKAFESWKIKKIFFPIFNNTIVCPLSVNLFKNFISKKNILKKRNLKIYISRKDVKTSRILINEDEIIKILRKKNYKIYNFSKLNMLKKLKILSSANVIVAPVGAGLFNLFFSNLKNIKLFLITGKLYLPREYLDLAYYKKLKLCTIIGKVIPSYSQWWSYDHSSLYLDKKLIEKLP